MPRSKKEKAKRSPGREALSWVLSLLIAVAVALLIRAYVFEFIRVDGPSMTETLKDGERMFVTKYDYLLGEPDRFDIVICHYPGRTGYFVKRLVGLPGDTLSISGGKLYLNGDQVDEPYIDYPPRYEMESYTVPEGKCFVLGDNRANSNDSHLIGPLDRGQIVGHARYVVFPFANMRPLP